MSSTSKSRFENIVKSKCPKCHSGYLFIDKNPYHLSQIFKMNDRCSHCNQSFSPEPRFFDGAMYVSYAFSVMIVAIVFITFPSLSDNAPLIPMILTTIGATVLISPLSFRLSRTVWIHVFYNFDKSKI